MAGVIATLDEVAREARPKRHVMAVMSAEAGDYKMRWDPDVKDEVAQARKTFDEMTGKGMVAYRMDRKGKQTELMRTFDPAAKALVLAPVPRGG